MGYQIVKFVGISAIAVVIGCQSAGAPGGQANNAKLPVGEYQGSHYENGRRNDIVDGAMSVRFSLKENGTYRFAQGSSPNTIIEGEPIPIAEGNATVQGERIVLKPTKDGTSELSVLGWSFDKELELKPNPDGSLSFMGKHNGITDVPPPGRELRLVKR